jgi:RHS repeat-associated protein
MVEIRLTNNTLVATYAFDGNSLRVIKVVGADRTWFIYAGTQLISEYDDAASATYSAGTQAGSATGETYSTLLYQHADHLTTRLTTENSTDTANEQRHYPYGESLQASGTADGSVLRKFTTYLKDWESDSGKLNYAVFRMQGSRIGRFLRPDPLHGRSNPQRLNRYAYVLNSPTTRTDPNGLESSDGLDTPCDPSTFHCDGQEWDPDFQGDAPSGSGSGFWAAPGTPGFGPAGLPLPGFPGLLGTGGGGIGQQGGTGGGGMPCNCRWYDLFCLFVCALLDPPPQGCKVDYFDGPSGGTCNPGDIFIKGFTCSGESECCRKEKTKFSDWCEDHGKDKKNNLAYAHALYWSWYPDNLYCCGVKKQAKKAKKK